MRVSISRSMLASVLPAVARLADARATIPSLAHVRVSAAGRAAHFAATDLTLSGFATVVADVDDPGEILIPAKALADVCKRDRRAGGVVTIETVWTDDKSGAGRVSIQLAGGAAVDLPYLPARDFPKLPDHLGWNGDAVDAHAFTRILSVALPAVSTDETRLHLNGVLLAAEDRGIAAVATDGHRLARASAEIDLPSLRFRVTGNEGPGCGRFLLPRKGAEQLVRLAGRGAEPIRLAIVGEYLLAAYGGVTLAVKGIEAVFPPYHQVIPREPGAQRATVWRAALAAAVRDVMVATGKAKWSGVVLGFADGACRVTREGDDTEAHVEIGADFADDAPDVLDAVGVNGKYLLDALDTIASNRVTIGFDNALSPIRIDGDADSVHVIMPYRADLSPRFLPAAKAPSGDAVEATESGVAK